MSLINYYKEINIGWKLSLFLVVFCMWPLSAYLIFNFHEQLFAALDLFKLSLLSSATAAPFLVLNSAVSLLLANPRDNELKWSEDLEPLIAGTVFIGVVITILILATGAAIALANGSIITVKIVMTILETIFLTVVIWSKVVEDRRFKEKKHP